MASATLASLATSYLSEASRSKSTCDRSEFALRRVRGRGSASPAAVARQVSGPQHLPQGYNTNAKRVTSKCLPDRADKLPPPGTRRTCPRTSSSPYQSLMATIGSGCAPGAPMVRTIKHTKFSGCRCIRYAARSTGRGLNIFFRNWRVGMSPHMPPGAQRLSNQEGPKSVTVSRFLSAFFYVKSPVRFSF